MSIKYDLIATKKKATLSLYKLDVAIYEWRNTDLGVSVGPYSNEIQAVFDALEKGYMVHIGND